MQNNEFIKNVINGSVNQELKHSLDTCVVRQAECYNTMADEELQKRITVTCYEEPPKISVIENLKFRAIVLNDSVAYFELGKRYEEGHGVVKNISQALKYYQQSAERGYDVAQLYLAFLYEEGRHFRQNHKKAFKWFLSAAEKGNLEAQFYVAMCYEKGRGVKPSDIAAVKWLSCAASSNYEAATLRLNEAMENTSDVLHAAVLPLRQ